MNAAVEQKAVVARYEESIQSILEKICDNKERLVGIAIITDESGVLLGVLNHGDILRLIASGESLDKCAGDLMNIDPITARAGSSEKEVVRLVRDQLFARTKGKKDVTRFVPLVDDSGVVIDIMDLFAVMADASQGGEHVELYGLGFVGLTLGVALASRGHLVSAVDTNQALVHQLKHGVPHVFEPRLAEMLQQTLKDRQISLGTAPPSEHHNVVIISVGTPIDEKGQASLEALSDVCAVVAARLRRGDLVMLRSTIPVGTTRGIVREELENGSGLTAGIDYNLAFTPERTVEGNAMQELSTLPQVVGGYSNACVERAVGFWQTLTSSVVRADSLEAAELVKLINNSYRDLSFAFSNGLALLADRYNLDAARVIATANEGYPRNPIPRPSPGVGGYCLTKDPFLYGSIDLNAEHSALSLAGRAVNKRAGAYPMRVLERFAARFDKDLSELSVAIAGIAFKGVPETNDIRGSNAVDLYLALEKAGCKVFAFDSVVTAEELLNAGMQPVDLLDVAETCDAIMIMNNHAGNVPQGLMSKLATRKTLIFDGWSLLDRHEVQNYRDVVYATMGYMTPDEQTSV